MRILQQKYVQYFYRDWLKTINEYIHHLLVYLLDVEYAIGKLKAQQFSKDKIGMSLKQVLSHGMIYLSLKFYLINCFISRFINFLRLINLLDGRR